MALPDDVDLFEIQPDLLKKVTETIIAQLISDAPAWGMLPLVSQSLRLVLIDKGRQNFIFTLPGSLTPIWDMEGGFTTNLTAAVARIFRTDVRVILVKEENKGVFLGSYPANNDRVQQIAVSSGPELELVASRCGSPMETDKLPGNASRLPASPIDIVPIEQDLRNWITQPNRVVVMPGYLTRWIPYLGPLRTSILVAFFQSFFQSVGSSAAVGITFESSAARIAELAGISPKSVFRHMDDPQLAVFLKKVPFRPNESVWYVNPKTGANIRKPNRYEFHAIVLLTPGDRETLRVFLEKAGIKRNPESALRKIIAQRIEPRDVFDFPAAAPADDWVKTTVRYFSPTEAILDMIADDELRHRKDFVDMASEIASRLVPSKDRLHLPWYFLVYWQSIIGHGAGWIINLVRDRCFYDRVTGELRDREYIQGGYEELRRAIGISRVKTIREWFPYSLGSERQALYQPLQSNISKFVAMVDPEMDRNRQVYAFTMQMAMLDPMTPVHEKIYLALVRVARLYAQWDDAHRKIFLSAFDQVVQGGTDGAGEPASERSRAIDLVGADDDDNVTATLDLILDEFDLLLPHRLGGIVPMRDENLGGIVPMKSANLGGIVLQYAQTWAELSRLLIKHSVVNHLNIKSLINIFKHLNQLTTTNTGCESNNQPVAENHQELVVVADKVDVATEEGEIFSIKAWEVGTLLEEGNIRGRVKQELIGKGVTSAAAISCYLYMSAEASGNGDHNRLGPGYAVSTLRESPTCGQGGGYLKMAKLPPIELFGLMVRHIQYGSASTNIAWQRVMGNPPIEKMLELVDRLGLDREYFEDLRLS